MVFWVYVYRSLSYNRVHFIMVYAGHYGPSTGWIVRLLGNWMQLSRGTTLGKAAVPASQLLLGLSGKSKKTLTQILRFILTAMVSQCDFFLSTSCFSRSCHKKRVTSLRFPGIPTFQLPGACQVCDKKRPKDSAGREFPQSRWRSTSLRSYSAGIQRNWQWKSYRNP